MDIKNNFNSAKDLIDNAHNILLTMHERMDGDDGGALLAIAAQLKQQNKLVTCVVKKGVPPTLEFLPGSQNIQEDITDDNYDLLVTFGCSNIERIGSLKIKNLTHSAGSGQELKIINFDHHPDNEFFGQVNIVNPRKSSVAELVYDYLMFHNFIIDKDIATCLLTGIITDTGSFMHSNTEHSTLKAAAVLMKKGALVNRIVSHTLKNKPFKVLKAWGKALENLHYDAGRKIIYSVITENDLTELQGLPEAAFEGLAETLNTFPEAKFALFLRQDGQSIKGSLRSEVFKNIDVSKIAKAFGGGGHKLAAGFSVAGKLVRDEFDKWKVI